MGDFGAKHVSKDTAAGILTGFVPLVAGYPVYHGGGLLSGDKLDKYPPLTNYVETIKQK